MDHIKHAHPRLRDTGGRDGTTEVEVVQSFTAQNIPVGTFIESILRSAAPLQDALVTTHGGVVTVRGWKDATSDDIMRAARSRATILNAREEAAQRFPMTLVRRTLGV